MVGVPYRAVLVLASEELAREIMSEVEDYIQNRRGKEMFEDAGYVQKVAIAEYIANQRGHTLYERKADYPKNSTEE